MGLESLISEGTELALGLGFVKHNSFGPVVPRAFRVAAFDLESSYNRRMDDEFRAELRARRARVREQLQKDSEKFGGGPKGSVLLLFSAPVHLRNGDVEHTYRQHSDFYYLTGFEEPESALLIFADAPGFVLFVRERDREREIWDGLRAGTEGALSQFGADVSHSIKELSERLPDYLEGRRRVFYLLGEEEAWDRAVMTAVSAVRARRRRRIEAPSEIVDARRLVHEMRLKKSAFEQRKMADVGSVSAAGHRAAMAAARPLLCEWELQNVVESVFRQGGARRVAYDSIVGSGPNATILHYRESQRVMGEGELVLIDAGAEKDFLAADITRTFPVSGRFSPVQRRLYEIVLNAQLAAIERTTPGVTLEEIHDAAFQVLRRGIIEEGLLGDTDPNDEKAVDERVRRFYMHRTSHYLGMDVHDVGAYFEDSEPRKLEPGMVITIEPGLYFAPDDETIDPIYRGIGIRIEDDILVTESGARNLTADAPKTVDEIEAACRASGS